MNNKKDILNNIQLEYNIHTHGLVKLLDCMPRVLDIDTVPDSLIAEAARTSYGKGTKKLSDDAGLIRYLMRHRHTTPFEMVEFKFYIKCPIYIARQWMRHRTASINEYSGRYSEMLDEFYIPEVEYLNGQHATNKQMSSDEVVVDFQKCQDIIKSSSEESFKEYMDLLSTGLSRETARTVLPLNIYTQFYWKINLHNLFHFLSLRMDSHAQKEIIDYANIIYYKFVQQLFPIASNAFEDYVFYSKSFSKTEMIYIQEAFKYINIDELIENNPVNKLLSKKEITEFKEKLKKTSKVVDGNIVPIYSNPGPIGRPGHQGTQGHREVSYSDPVGQPGVQGIWPLHEVEHKSPTGPQSSIVDGDVFSGKSGIDWRSGTWVIPPKWAEDSSKSGIIDNDAPLKNGERFFDNLPENKDINTNTSGFSGPSGGPGNAGINPNGWPGIADLNSNIVMDMRSASSIPAYSYVHASYSNPHDSKESLVKSTDDFVKTVNKILEDCRERLKSYKQQ